GGGRRGLQDRRAVRAGGRRRRALGRPDAGDRLAPGGPAAGRASAVDPGCEPSGTRRRHDGGRTPARRGGTNVSLHDTLVVTGGAGFIGSAWVRGLVATGSARVVTIDALTYAGDRGRLVDAGGEPRHRFVELDVLERDAVLATLRSERPRAIVHLAAETHVDRSIDGPEAFARTNTIGTLRLLDATLAYWRDLGDDDRDAFRLVNVSTDEVYGSL